VNLLLDASFPPRMARALHQLGAPAHRVDHVRDALGNDASDQHVADFLRDHDTTVLVGIDLGISETPHRLEALAALGGRVALLHRDWLDANPWDQAWQLAAVLPALLRKLERCPPPAVLLVPRFGQGRIRKAG
jgi:hypothetical protein